MSPGLMVLLAAAAVLFVLAPLRRSAPPPPPPEEARTGLLRAREAAYQALHDAEFDHATGKISDADYADLRARNADRVGAILRRLAALDRLDADPPA